MVKNREERELHHRGHVIKLVRNQKLAHKHTNDVSLRQWWCINQFSAQIPCQIQPIRKMAGRIFFESSKREQLIKKTISNNAFASNVSQYDLETRIIQIIETSQLTGMISFR
jgi:hypothetical protein